MVVLIANKYKNDSKLSTVGIKNSRYKSVGKLKGEVLNIKYRTVT